MSGLRSLFLWYRHIIVQHLFVFLVLSLQIEDHARCRVMQGSGEMKREKRRFSSSARALLPPTPRIPSLTVANPPCCTPCACGTAEDKNGDDLQDLFDAGNRYALHLNPSAIPSKAIFRMATDVACKQLESSPWKQLSPLPCLEGRELARHLATSASLI
jgi:hypothetical protein